MQRFSAFSAYILALLATTGCSPRSVMETYIPLTVGNEWVFDAVALPGKPSSQGTARQVLRESAERSGKRYFKCERWLDGDEFPSGSIQFLRADERGVFSVEDNSTGEDLEIPLPPTRGRTWKLKRRGMSLDGEVVGREDVAIGSRVFKDCVRIRLVGSTPPFL
jgi:hypothetical protein